ncbi:DoxX family protein [Williamsia sp.]|uniref:DoxX family protein n=1 Tax=Williamsia sp. TaxID=1872085 RepID=UPI002F91F421
MPEPADAELVDLRGAVNTTDRDTTSMVSCVKERDPDGQGSSPYDEPTEQIELPLTRAHDPRRAQEGDTGEHGYAPYRARGLSDDGGGFADNEAELEETEQIPTMRKRQSPDPVPAEMADQDTDVVTTTPVTTTPAADAPPSNSTTRIPVGAVDRDDFHREYGPQPRYDDDDDFAARGPAEPEPVNPLVTEVPARRGTLDLGLLLLRLGVGLIAMAHGSQKLFGWWNGPRLSGFEDYLVNASDTSIGFNSDAAKPLAVLGALSETIGGLMLVVGLLTPVAGSAVLGVMFVASAYKATLAGGVWFFASDPDYTGGGIEFELFLALAAAVIILTGPGRISLDFGRGWATRPYIGSVIWLVIGIAVPITIWFLFNGTNPFESPGNPAP